MHTAVLKILPAVVGLATGLACIADPPQNPSDAMGQNTPAARGGERGPGAADDERPRDMRPRRGGNRYGADRGEQADEELTGQALTDRIDRALAFNGRVRERLEDAQRLVAEGKEDEARRLLHGTTAAAARMMRRAALEGFDSGERRRYGPPPDRERIREFVKENLTEVESVLGPGANTDTEEAQRALERLAPRLQEIIELREHDPELADAKLAELRSGVGVIRAMTDLRSALAANVDADTIDALEADLTGLVAEQFDQRIETRLLEIDRMERLIERMRAQSDSTTKDEAVTQITARLIEKAHAEAERIRTTDSPE